MAARQLTRAEVTRDQIHTRLASGLLIPKHRGVYAVGHEHETWGSQAVAALLTVGPEARLFSHTAAAIEGFRPTPDDGLIHLLIPHGSGGRSRPGIVVHRSVREDHLEPKWVRGLPLTRTAVTLLALAADLTHRELERALDEALTLELVTLAELRAVLDAAPHHRGAPALRYLLDQRLVANRPRSEGQELMLALIRAAGLPDPVGDADIGGGFTADFFWPRQRVAGEYDSRRWHRSKWARARDRRKDVHCERNAISMVRAEWEDLQGELALRLVARFTRLLTERGL